uniref:Myb/SANT-like DNA-binding domain-containing protein n=1 Tax=Anopheles farauti TaxID=69004 RepID=A0A182QG84_9DIPT
MTTTSASPATTDGSRPSSSRLSQKQRTPSDGTDSSSCGATREPWFSTNKILNSSLCGRRINSRNPNFDYDETKLLISLWGDPVVQKTLITTHKKHPVIAELARKMRDHGYNRSTEEINTRIKNLKCFYNRIKKDMAAGIINQTTWRHYAEMDEIISRPVFGNAHRLQQQNQPTPGKPTPAKHEADANDTAKDALAQFPVKLEVMSDDDDEFDEATEIRAEDLLTIDTQFPEETGPAGGAVGAMRTRRGARNGGAGRNRKQAEDDDDEDDEDDDDEYDDDEGSDFDVENEFNDGLDELLQKAQATKTTPGVATSSSLSKPPTQGLTTTTTPAKTANASGLVIETITSGNGTTITAAAGTATSNPPSAGKISVVPTNLLMKQPSSVASSLATPIQIYTQPTMSLAKGVVSGATASMVATAGSAVSGAGGAPMKLLLVNTVGKDGTTQQILTPATDSGTGMPKLIPAPGIQHSKIPLSVTGGPTPIVTIPTLGVPKKVVEATKAPHSGGQNRSPGAQSAGFRTLLTQLVAIQRENLALNQERLALEKERLQYEKQFGGSLVSMVRNMSTFFSGMLQHQRKDQQLNESQHQTQEPAPSKAVEKPKKNPDQVTSPPTVAPDNAKSQDVREISSSPSPSSSSSSSTSRVASPTSTTKAPTANDSGNEAKSGEPKAGSKRTEPSSTPPPLTPAPSIKPSSTSDVSSVPKKRRMMTRHSANHAQPAAENGNADDALKTEVISDAEEQ